MLSFESSNAILRSKWDAWTAQLGQPTEKAMLDFIDLIDKIEELASEPIENKNVATDNATNNTDSKSIEAGVSSSQRVSSKPLDAPINDLERILLIMLLPAVLYYFVGG